MNRRLRADAAFLPRQNDPHRHRLLHRRRLRSLGAGLGALLRQVHSRQPDDPGAEHAGRGIDRRDQLSLQRRQARRLDAGRAPAGDLFRPTGRPQRSSVRFRQDSLDRLARAKRHHPLHARRLAVQIHRRYPQSQRSAALRQFGHRHDRILYSRACSTKYWAPNTQSSAAIPAARRSIWRSSAAKSIAGRRWWRPTLAANPISVGRKPMVRVVVQFGTKVGPAPCRCADDL